MLGEGTVPRVGQRELGGGGGEPAHEGDVEPGALHELGAERVEAAWHRQDLLGRQLRAQPRRGRLACPAPTPRENPGLGSLPTCSNRQQEKLLIPHTPASTPGSSHPQIWRRGDPARNQTPDIPPRPHAGFWAASQGEAADPDNALDPTPYTFTASPLPPSPRTLTCHHVDGSQARRPACSGEFQRSSGWGAAERRARGAEGRDGGGEGGGEREGHNHGREEKNPHRSRGGSTDPGSEVMSLPKSKKYI